MGNIIQLIREQIDFDSRLRNPVQWFLWLSTAIVIAVVVFDWRPSGVLEPVFIAGMFLGAAGVVILLLMYAVTGSLGQG